LSSERNPNLNKEAERILAKKKTKLKNIAKKKQKE